MHEWNQEDLSSVQESVLEEPNNEYVLGEDDENLRAGALAEIEVTVEAEMNILEAEDIPSIEAMHQTWAQRWIKYEEAAKNPIPYGRHRGKCFGEALAARRQCMGNQRCDNPAAFLFPVGDNRLCAGSGAHGEPRTAPPDDRVGRVALGAGEAAHHRALYTGKPNTRLACYRLSSGRKHAAKGDTRRR